MRKEAQDSDNRYPMRSQLSDRMVIPDGGKNGRKRSTTHCETQEEKSGPVGAKNRLDLRGRNPT